MLDQFKEKLNQIGVDYPTIAKDVQLLAEATEEHLLDLEKRIENSLSEINATISVKDIVAEDEESENE